MSSPSGLLIIPPPQPFLTLREIFDVYGSRSVVAYACRVVDGQPKGGYVIAVQEQPGTDVSRIKLYQSQFIKKYPHKMPVCYIRLEGHASRHALTLFFDDGTGGDSIRAKSIPKKPGSTVPGGAKNTPAGSGFSAATQIMQSAKPPPVQSSAEAMTRAAADAAESEAMARAIKAKLDSHHR
jgi:hypothetical protein